MASYDVIVVGAGVMGSAAAYQLARRGRRVLLLEQFEPGHRRGSSHGSSRIIRYSYETPGYVRLMAAAYAAWAELEREAGEALLMRSGGLDIGPSDDPTIAACRASLAAAGVSHELLGPAELRRRFPQFAPGDGAIGLYQADAGILPASRCVAALQDRARAHGATVRAGAAAELVEPRAGGATVRLAGGEALEAGAAVLACGSYLGRLLAPLGLALPLRVTREQVVYFRPAEPERFALGRMPIFIEYGPDAPLYGFPIFGADGLKAARHGAGPEVADVGAGQAPPDAAESTAVAAALERLLPGAAGAIRHAETCRYTHTPDGDFLIDRHPEHGQIVIASPCSGHGFKFGALVGAILADLAEGRGPAHDIAPFRIGRF